MIGILSDDLTGANGVAAMFATRGLRACTVLGPVWERRAANGADLVVIDTNSRDSAPEAAAAAVRVALAELGGDAIVLPAQRIDTTLRGNIAAETEALLTALGDPTVAVVVPAAPATGRTAIGGRVFIWGRPLTEVTGGEDTPRVLFARQGIATAAVPLATVRSGARAVARTLAAAVDGGVRAVICDAEHDADLVTLAAGVRATGIRVLPVDPGSFTLALADAYGLLGETGRSDAACQPSTETPATADAVGAGRGAGNIAPAPVDVDGVTPGAPVLAVLGSRAAVAVEQARVAVASGWLRTLDVDVSAILGRQDGRLRESDRVLRALHAGVSPALALRPAPCIDAGEHAVAQALAAVTWHTLAAERGVRGLFLSGGAVGRAVLDALGARAIAVTGEVLPLAASGRLKDGSATGMRVVTKGGMIGKEDAIIACLRALTMPPRM